MFGKVGTKSESDQIIHTFKFRGKTRDLLKQYQLFISMSDISISSIIFNFVAFCFIHSACVITTILAFVSFTQLPKGRKRICLPVSEFRTTNGQRNICTENQNETDWSDLRYESSTLYKELSSTIFQSLSVRQASITPVQISTLCNIKA